VTILCYHAVDPDWASPLSVRPVDFAGQMVWLVRRRGVVDLSVAAEKVGREGRLPRGLVAVSFDDGFASVYEHALPALQRNVVPATVFLVARTLTGDDRPVDWVDDPPSRPVGTLTLAQIEEMQAAGVTFGSHSLAHRNLTELSDEECERDLRESREILEGVLDRAVTMLAYPRGLNDPRIRRAARSAGFSYGFTLPEGPEPFGRLGIPRIGVYRGNTVAHVAVKTSRWYLRGRTSRPYHLLARALRKGRPSWRLPG
jgi:peptidoglycan/xylan/chitin deacetylase (PgdA/CDA1 family)